MRQSPPLSKEEACRDDRGEENTGLPAANQTTAKGCCSYGLLGDTEEVGLRVAVLTVGDLRGTCGLCHRPTRCRLEYQGVSQYLWVTPKDSAGPITDGLATDHTRGCEQ